MIKSFQKKNLKVEKELCNHRVYFLNITIDLEKKQILTSPLRKENAKNIFINFHSNNPYLIEREIPSIIQT